MFFNDWIAYIPKSIVSTQTKMYTNCSEIDSRGRFSDEYTSEVYYMVPLHKMFQKLTEIRLSVAADCGMGWCGAAVRLASERPCECS